MLLSTAKLIVFGTLVTFAIAEVIAGRFFVDDRPGDKIADLITAIAVPGVIFTTIMLITNHGLKAVAPELAGAWSHWPGWLMFIVLLLADDLTQYAWHRTTHSVPWLYALHRAHHAAPYLSVRIVYRNSLIYYLLMPSLWLAGTLVYLGFIEVYALYVSMKMAVIIGAHSSVPWDEPLYRFKATRPLMWVLERLISTPSTHAAHHGKHAADGVTHYKGNYGNFLFLWDVLFGTAHITRRRPDAYGIENLGEMNPIREVLVPGQPS